MCWSEPRTSTNWRSIQRIRWSSISFSTEATVAFFDFAGVLEAIAMSFPPRRIDESVPNLGTNLDIYKLLFWEIVQMTVMFMMNETLFDKPRRGQGDVDHSTGPGRGDPRCLPPSSMTSTSESYAS